MKVDLQVGWHVWELHQITSFEKKLGVNETSLTKYW